MATSGIRCIAVIAKENYPLLIKFCPGNDGAPNGGDEELKFHYMVYASLDIVQEKLGGLPSQNVSGNQSTGNGPAGSASGTSPTISGSSAFPKMGHHNEPQGGLYLGSLYSLEEYRVYGYVSNTQVKFILVLDASFNPATATAASGNTQIGPISPSQGHVDTLQQQITNASTSSLLIDPAASSNLVPAPKSDYPASFHVIPSPIPFAPSNHPSLSAQISSIAGGSGAAGSGTALVEYVKSRFAVLHDAYVKTVVCNPFYDPGEPIRTRSSPGLPGKGEGGDGGGRLGTPTPTHKFERIVDFMLAPHC